MSKFTDSRGVVVGFGDVIKDLKNGIVTVVYVVNEEANVLVADTAFGTGGYDKKHCMHDMYDCNNTPYVITGEVDTVLAMKKLLHSLTGELNKIEEEGGDEAVLISNFLYGLGDAPQQLKKRLNDLKKENDDE